MKHVNVMEEDAEKKKSKLEEMTPLCKRTESDLKLPSQNLIHVIDLIETKLLDELEAIVDKETEQLKADITTGEKAIEIYQQQLRLIDQAGISVSEMLDVYQIYQLCESGIKESGDPVRRTVSRICLKKNTDKLMEVLLEFVEVEVEHVGVLDLTATPLLQDTIYACVAGDPWRPSPVDVVVLDVNGIETIVVTDYSGNACVKSFYRRNNQACHSKLNLESCPWGLAQLNYNQVAVTVLNCRQIVNIVNPELKLKSAITTRKQYNGITALTPSTIAAGTRYPPSVDILDMEGTIIRSLTPTIDNNNKSLLSNPCFLCSTMDGNILVSDICAKCVVCLTPHGDVVFNFSPAEDAVVSTLQGVTVTTTGDILVADSSLHTVLHLSESGQFIRNVLSLQKGVLQPQGLCIGRGGCLYVCLSASDVIKVFKFVKGTC